MSKETSDKLIKKYLAAESTLDEEEKLFSTENHTSGMEEWSAYVRQRRKKAPANFNDLVRASIQTRKKRRQRFFVGLSGMAATIAFFVAIALYNTKDKNPGYDEKEAALKEALSMFSDENLREKARKVIYEDDIIVIYTVLE